MAPTIRSGDRVEVRPLGPAPVRRGDVVLCRAEGGRLLAHRVIGVDRGGDGLILRTQGDALTGADAPIDGSQVLGRVVAVERRGRRHRLDHAPLRLAGLAWICLAPLRRWLGRGVGRRP
jgi:hypothetical protein